MVKTIFNELYQASNMKKNPSRKFKFPCPFFLLPFTTTTTFILSITTPQRSRTITMRIKIYNWLLLIALIGEGKNNNIPRGEIIKKKKSNNNTFSKCVKGDNKYSVWCMDVFYNVYEWKGSFNLCQHLKKIYKKIRKIVGIGWIG